MAQFAYVM